VYRRLVDAPSRHWTVGELSEDIGAGVRGRPDGIRSVLYVLLADRVLTTIPGQRALTVALTLSGVRALRVLLTSWHDSR
jgi:hypothetical protein